MLSSKLLQPEQERGAGWECAVVSSGHLFTSHQQQRARSPTRTSSLRSLEHEVPDGLRKPSAVRLLGANDYISTRKQWLREISCEPLFFGTCLLSCILDCLHCLALGPAVTAPVQDTPREPQQADERQFLKLTINDSTEEPCALSRGSLAGVLWALQVLEYNHKELSSSTIIRAQFK